MGQVDVAKGNLFTTPLPLIVHSVNCKGVFGAGFAAVVQRRYPEVKRRYIRKHEAEGWKLGDIQIVLCDDGRHIANIAGQESYGRDGKAHASYDAIRDGAEKAARLCVEKGWRGFACPRLGCGLGGLEWDKVLADLEIIAEGYDIDIDVYFL